MRYTILILSILLLGSCKTTEYITKVETKTDTLIVKERITDTIIREKTIEITKPIRNNVFLPCPDDKKKPTSGGSSSGNSNSSWQYDEEKGGYNVELYCAEQISTKDSIIQKLEKEIETHTKRVSEKSYEKTVVKEKKTFWNSILKNIWKMLFFIIFLLWVFGITPRYILRLIIKV